jgi:hypothetical protein
LQLRRLCQQVARIVRANLTVLNAFVIFCHQLRDPLA